MRDSNVEPGTLQLILDQLEELVVTLIAEIRERPGVALAVLAAAAGALVGAALAARGPRRRVTAPAARGPRRRVAAPSRVARGASSVGAAGELMGLGVKLIQNPIVRGFVFATAQKQLRRRLRL
jgi:hypothetical protein